MSRTKKDPRNGIAEREWLVYDSYNFGSRKMKRIDALPFPSTIRGEHEQRNSNRKFLNGYVDAPTIIRTSELATCFSLCNPDLYKVLLEKYINIKDEWDALEYVKEWGFPSSDFVPINSPQEEGCLVAELLQSAQYLRWLDFLSEAIRKKETRQLDNCIKEIEVGDMLGVYVRTPTKEPVYPFETSLIQGHYRATKAIQDPLLYSTQEWKKQGAKKSLHAAQKYLKYSLNRLLTGVQPILDWAITAEGEWVLDEYVLVATPWQAICYALLLNIIGKERLVSCPRCTKRFRPNHKGHHYCSPACNKAHSTMRVNGEGGVSFNKYPKTRKGKGNEQKKI